MTIISDDPLGQDFSVLPELSFQVKSGLENLREALARRLMTPRGGLWYDASYGLDIRQFIGEAVDDGGYEIAALIEAELEGDERVLNATVTITGLTLDSLDFTAEVETARGPFQLIGGASAVRGVILNANPNLTPQAEI